MVRSIQKIEQELEAIATRAASLNDQLRQAYLQYLTRLGHGVQKQLVLASYQICTQSYPEAFLALSLSQRESLQQSLRQLGDRAHQELPQLLDIPPSPPQASDAPPKTRKVAYTKVLEIPPEALEALAAASESEDDEIPPEALESMAAALESATEDFSPPDLDPRSPLSLLSWYKFLNRQINLQLQTISMEANEQLHEFGILPSELPAKLLEMALQAEDSLIGNNQGANLLNLVVEAEREEEHRENTVMHVAAIRLRLSEIEFADSQLSAERNRVRQLLREIKQLSKNQQKCQRDWAIAKAEAAWRSSWHE
ncbi:MAG: hypothetical protein SAJ12_06065 [Jaaginema sp. PMC 1079.18]|nr:hypothetical protein [Jaaginema sp. PMC 1080.18]MEC4850557.1 hypothetical protein [Jaaginema sp. PMC 1079.18]MEC4865471.1 hypothetical protein [Jaaginema sp. PMC 1078.18]